MVVVKRKLRDADSISRRKVDYHIEGYSTKKTITMVNEVLRVIDKVTRVIHYRDLDNKVYVTYILGIRGAIRVEGGLTSGGTGVGVKGLHDILERCGFEREEIWMNLTEKATGVGVLEFIS